MILLKEQLASEESPLAPSHPHLDILDRKSSVQSTPQTTEDTLPPPFENL